MPACRRNQMEGQINLRDAVRRNISFRDPKSGKTYQLKPKVRPYPCCLDFTCMRCCCIELCRVLRPHVQSLSRRCCADGGAVRAAARVAPAGEAHARGPPARAGRHLRLRAVLLPQRQGAP